MLYFINGFILKSICYYCNSNYIMDINLIIISLVLFINQFLIILQILTLTSTIVEEIVQESDVGMPC